MPINTIQIQNVKEELERLHNEIYQVEDDVAKNLKPVYVSNPETGEKIQVTEDYVNSIILGMAKKISTDFAGKSVFFLGVMDGGNYFANKLTKVIEKLNAGLFLEKQVRVNYSTITTSSYEGTERGELKIGDLKVEVGNQIVMFLDDVLDSGATLEGLEEDIDKYGPAEVYSAVLCTKKHADRTKKATYSGLDLGSEFLVGAGMDLLTPNFRLKPLMVVDEATKPPRELLKSLKDRLKELNAKLRDLIVQEKEKLEQKEKLGTTNASKFKGSFHRTALSRIAEESDDELTCFQSLAPGCGVM